MKEIIEILELLHDEANRAYWNDNNDCGGQYDDGCEEGGCRHNIFCRESGKISRLIKELKGGNDEGKAMKKKRTKIAIRDLKVVEAIVYLKCARRAMNEIKVDTMRLPYARSIEKKIELLIGKLTDRIDIEF